MNTARVTRRRFLGGAAAAGLFTIVPRHVLGAPGAPAPSDRINVAGIGASGQAMHDLGQVGKETNIIALADVDWKRAEKAILRWPEAKKYDDFRVMLGEMADQIDAVVVATPDHTHAVAAMAAMKLGKPVYVEKPMAHDVFESRALVRTAAEKKLVTQMGNQGHSQRSCHRTKGWMEKKLIGGVTEVHCWTDRPTWPQGIGRPSETPPVPETLDWDLWLGTAPERPYNPAYCPRNWRGWWDFGTGALGDMGCHILDAPYYALELGAPNHISAETSGVNDETGPKSEVIRYSFPARGDWPAMTLIWHDGGNTPERPKDLPDDARMGDNDGGAYFVGEEGVLVHGTYGGGPKMYRNKKEIEGPKIDVERSHGHHIDWARACRGEGKTLSPFSYAGPLTELVMLGVIAARVSKPLDWDGAAMQFTNLPEANQYLKRDYRGDWSL